MTVINDLLAAVPADHSRILDVRIGAAWTAVVAEVDGARRCGLAATLSRLGHVGPSVRDAGHLHERSGRALCDLAHSSSPAEVAVGMAAINALLPRAPSTWVDVNAAEVLAERGRNGPVALIGHFPFVDWLRERIANAVGAGTGSTARRPASQHSAADIVPQAGVVAITSMTLLNHTFDGLLALRRPDAQVMLLGPTHAVGAAAVPARRRPAFRRDCRGYRRGAEGRQPGRWLPPVTPAGRAAGDVNAAQREPVLEIPG
jgi:uncharacterized protein